MTDKNLMIAHILRQQSFVHTEELDGKHVLVTHGGRPLLTVSAEDAAYYTCLFNEQAAEFARGRMCAFLDFENESNE